MNKRLAAKIVVHLKRKVTYWRFLLLHKLDKEQILSIMSDEKLYYEVFNALEENDFSAKRVSRIYKSVSLNLFGYKITDGFIKDAYSYVLYKSFPEAVIDYPSEVDERIFELYLVFLKIFNQYQKTSNDKSFMSIYPLEFLNEKEILHLENSTEYNIFIKAFDTQCIYEMMKLNYEVNGHSTIEHILGVHHLAMYIARQVQSKHIPIDLGRISASAAGHDIGKFGCKPDEKHKIAYYHYYYTNEWFERLDLKYSKNVAVNHSTWDLELESLSLESLILIFSDFCVKKSNDKSGIFKMKFLNVDESFDVILSKLDNINEKKKRRYEKVYQKLKNFSEYLIKLGVNLVLENYTGEIMETNIIEEEKSNEFIEWESVNLEYNKFYSLNHGNGIVENLKFLAIDNSVRLMHKLRNETSLNDIIQEASSEKDIQIFRRYIFIFEEYSTYLTPEQKLITIEFLSDYLVHFEEDIRKSCANLIGKLIAYYNENYTKELPESADVVYKIENKIGIIKEIIDSLIEDSTRITPAKLERQANSNFEVLKSIFEHCDEDTGKKVVELVCSYLSLDYLDSYSIMFLLFVLEIIPQELISEVYINQISEFVLSNINSDDEEIRITSISKINSLFSSDLREMIIQNIGSGRYNEVLDNYVSDYENFSVAEKFFSKSLIDHNVANTEFDFSEFSYSKIYLSNLKSATPKIVKRLQIELLYRRSLDSKSEVRFYTAMHFCNILKVSAHESVRNTAGNYLLLLFDLLSSEQKNDIIIELIRSLEIEGYGFTRYIPDYLGKLIPRVELVEYNEIIEDIVIKVSNAGIFVRVLLLKTIGVVIKDIMINSNSKLDEIPILVGILFRGFYSGDKLTTQIAFNVISKDLIGDGVVSLQDKFMLFKLLYKKINIYMMEIKEFTEIDLLNFSVGLNYIYKFITDYLYDEKKMEFPLIDKAAFYYGSFDPFSLGQKNAALDARNLGMEVYIAINEFKWRRRTQPSLMRRQIVEMSIADSLDIYTFPPEIPINLWNPSDIGRLLNVFKEKELYIIIDEETLLNDELYNSSEHDIYSLNHIIYRRSSINYTDEKRIAIDDNIKNFTKDVMIRSLDQKYEMIDVELIRRNIDKNWDAFEVIDDLATKFIIEHNLYKNEPKYKSVVSPSNLSIKTQLLSECDDIFEYCDEFDLDKDIINQLNEKKVILACNDDASLERYILTISNDETGEILALSIYAKAEPKNLFDEIKNLEIIEEVERNKYSKILIFDYICSKANKKIHALDQIILTETITKEIANGYEYAIVKDFSISNSIYGVLLRCGFIERHCIYSKKRIFSVDTSSPVVLNLDGTTRMKSDFRQNEKIRDTIKFVRTNLQQALVNLYPGKLIISFDRSMLYNRIINLVSEVNKVPIATNNSLGEYICVPYGDIFKRWVLPNTVTKAFHTERYYTVNSNKYEVGSYPGYLSIKNQTNIIKSFNRPVMLVDDLFDKGNRLIALEKYFREYDIQIEKVIVGILSKRGVDLLKEKNIKNRAAYYIPNICVWFNESDLYPFLGGNSLFREGRESKKIIFSTNLILPFTYPEYIKNASKYDIYKLSEVCLSNTMVILTEIEKLYLEKYKRNLAIRNLGEVMITPRIPDIGSHVSYDYNYKPTDYIKNAIENLERMKLAFE